MNHRPGEGGIGMARAQDIAGILGTWSRGHRPLYQQLADALRAAIERRDLPPGARVPAERELARTLVVSRNTVASAYEELKDEGYLESRQGSGTRVVGGSVGGAGSGCRELGAPTCIALAPRFRTRGRQPHALGISRSRRPPAGRDQARSVRARAADRRLRRLQPRGPPGAADRDRAVDDAQPAPDRLQIKCSSRRAPSRRSTC